jgi:type III secretory pathway lipoprotein EscJ
MVTHIVFFALREENKSVHAQEAKQKIEAMLGQIDGLLDLEVGMNFSEEARAMDMVLIARLADRSALENYAVHPIHQAVITYIKSIAEYSKVVDFDG